MDLLISSAEITNAINTIWVLVTAFLVFFMQPGFAMLEAGLTRAKNVGNILMKNLMDFCMASIWDLQTRVRYLLIDKPRIERKGGSISTTRLL